MFGGEGTYYYKSSGDIYSGGWVAGIKAGDGAYMCAADNSQIVGTWNQGTVAVGRWLWADGTTWLGAFRDGKPLGRGVFYMPNGTATDGEYVLEPTDATGADAEAMVLTWYGSSVRVEDAGAVNARAPSAGCHIGPNLVTILA